MERTLIKINQDLILAQLAYSPGAENILLGQRLSTEHNDSQVARVPSVVLKHEKRGKMSEIADIQMGDTCARIAGEKQRRRQRQRQGFNADNEINKPHNNNPGHASYA